MGSPAAASRPITKSIAAVRKSGPLPGVTVSPAVATGSPYRKSSMATTLAPAFSFRPMVTLPVTIWTRPTTSPALNDTPRNDRVALPVAAGTARS